VRLRDNEERKRSAAFSVKGDLPDRKGNLMKLLVFSDIHGSLPAAGRLLALAAEHTPAAVILLGDILYHGPRNPQPEGYAPREVAAALNPLAGRIIAIRGNCDSDVDAMVLPFPLASDFSWLLDGNLRMFITHGHHYGPDSLPPLEEGDVLLFGHSHVPAAHTTAGGIHLCNPGSCAMPKEDHPACYGMFDDRVFSVFTMDGELYLQLDCV
jgi:putative phosphoesterase